MAAEANGSVAIAVALAAMPLPRASATAVPRDGGVACARLKPLLCILIVDLGILLALVPPPARVVAAIIWLAAVSPLFSCFVFCFCLVTPRMPEEMCAKLEEQVAAGSAKVFYADDASYASFVQETWGKDAPAAQTLVITAAMVIGMKIGYWDLSIVEAAAVFVMLFPLVAYTFWARAQKRGFTYAVLQSQNMPLFLGPTTLQFGTSYLPPPIGQIIQTNITNDPGQVAVLSVRFSDKLKQPTGNLAVDLGAALVSPSLCRIPLAQADVKAVAAFVTQHAEFYLPGPSVRSITSNQV